MSVSEESEHFFRISLLLLDTGGKTFRRKIQSLPSFTNFEEFLLSTKHLLYHLWKTRRCKCSPQPLPCTDRQSCTYSGKQQHLHKTQWDSLFRLQTVVCSCRNVHECTCLETEEEYCICAQSLDCPCVYHPIPGVDLQNLDLTLAGTILRNSDLLSKDEKEMVKEIMDMRNKVHGHTQNASLNTLNFNKYWSKISTEILKIAKGCNDSSFYTEILTDISRIKGTVLDKSNIERILLIWETFSSLTRMITDEQREIRDDQKQINKIIDKQYQEVSFAIKEISNTMVNTRSDIKGIKTDIKRLKRHKSEEPGLSSVARNLISSATLVLEKQKGYSYYTRQFYVFEEAKNRLNATKVLVLSGIGGRGKTSMAHELMLEITKMNSFYSPVIINEPSQWDEIVDGSRSLVIFIDDIFGKTNLDEKYLSAWEKRFDAMWACSSEGKVLLIIGCRKNILEEGKSTFEKYDLFKDEHTMDLSSPRYELSSNDKTGILMSYCKAFGVQTPSIPFDRKPLDKVLSHEDIRTIAQQRTLVGFPQLCNLFFTKPSFFEKGVDFFIHASEELVKDIAFLRRRKPSEYAVLLYALLKNNCILSDDLDEQLMTDVCKILQTSTLDCTDVQDLIVEQPLIAYLERSPVKKPLYQFKHITIFEAVLKSVSTSYPDFLLENAHPNVLMSYIRSANYIQKSGEISVSISAKSHYLLVKRLIHEKHNNMPLIVWHPSLSDNNFLLTVIETLDKYPVIEDIFLSCCTTMNVSLALGILDKEIRRCRRFDSGGSKSRHDTNLSIDTLKTAITFCLNINHYDLFVRILEYMRILSFGIESSVFVNLNVGNVPILMYTRIGLLANLLGRKQITEYLISEAKINTGVADFLGNTMLHYSVVHGWESMAGDLIQKDETLLNCMNKNGETPILMAAKVTYEEDIVLFLMKRDADISIKDNNGYSLAYYAALKGWINVIKAIELKCPAILSERNMDGNSPVIAVFKKMSTYMTTTKTLRRLLRMSNISALIDGDGNNVLHFLFRQPLLQDDIDIIGSILEKESTLLNQSNNKGETPLTYATKYSYPFTSNIPLFTKEFPVDLHISDKQGNTALHYLAFNGMIDLVEYIIQKDVSVIHNTNENAQTPLLFAFTNKHLTASKSTKLIQCFRHHDVDLNTCDKDENGILHYVALWASYQDIASLETVETLLSYNKDLIYARNKFRQVPFVYLVCSRTSVRSDFILTRMNSQLFNLLVSENLYTEDPDETGNTLLHYICRFGVLADEMKVMPHTSRRNIFRMDPISYAACYGTTDESIVAMNLTDEICLSVDHFGRSILHYCSLHFWPNAVRTILEKHKYEANLVDKAGDTPLMLALKYGKIKDGALSTLFDEKACECISTLLRHKEHVVVNQDGETMLHLYAAKTQVIREEIIEKAIKIDPDCLSKKNIHGLIPIMVHMKEKNKMDASEQYPFGRYYISNDDKLIPKDLFISDNDGNTVCHYCILHDIVGVVDIVKRGLTNILNETNRNGESPLVYAAWHGKGMNVIERLLEIADLQCSDLNGNTLLHVCLVNGWVELAEKIVNLDKGLLNYLNRFGQTPPMLALCLGCQTEEQMVNRTRSLLRMMDFSPKLQYKDYLGNTLLHYSALRCYLPLVKKILAEDKSLILLLNDEKQSATMYMMDNALLNWERAKPVLNFMLKFERRLEDNDRKGQNLIQYCSKSAIQTFFRFS